MKNSIKTIAVALALISTAAFAGNDENTKKTPSIGTGIYSSIDGSLHVHIEKDPTAAASVIILNSNKDVLIREVIGKKKTEVAYRFNLENLKDGKYELIVTSQGTKKTKEFTIQSEKTITERKLTIE